MKYCYKCSKWRDESEFSKDKKQKDGLQLRCKVCDKERNKLYRESHREYFKLKSQERYRPELNPERYAKNRDKYLERKNAYSKTIRGRLTTLLYSAKTRADKNNLDYQLDLEWLLSLYQEQEGCCLLTGIKLQFDSHHGGKRHVKPFSPSLDKIDPAKGYTKENTRLVCAFINLAINNFGEETFKQVATAYLSKLAVLTT